MYSSRNFARGALAAFSITKDTWRAEASKRLLEDSNRKFGEASHPAVPRDYPTPHRQLQLGGGKPPEHASPLGCGAAVENSRPLPHKTPSVFGEAWTPGHGRLHRSLDRSRLSGLMPRWRRRIH